MSGRVSFFGLSKKFVDSAESIPKESRDILYYTLSVGHHTGVIDCFTRLLSVPADEYERVVDHVGDDTAKRKLGGLEKFGEIEIDKTHAPVLINALRDVVMASDVFNEEGKTSVRMPEGDIEDVASLIGLLERVRDEPGMRLVVRSES